MFLIQQLLPWTGSVSGWRRILVRRAGVTAVTLTMRRRRGFSTGKLPWKKHRIFWEDVSGTPLFKPPSPGLCPGGWGIGHQALVAPSLRGRKEAPFPEGRTFGCQQPHHDQFSVERLSDTGLMVRLNDVSKVGRACKDFRVVGHKEQGVMVDLKTNAMRLDLAYKAEAGTSSEDGKMDTTVTVKGVGISL
ncbi:uncharacterized protein [Dermacentor andersoni]|uniref:uncharacterized protein n=1 Tax=Dermacentor andersoni TaxID=34620 RepID=UPI003B3B7EF3